MDKTVKKKRLSFLMVFALFLSILAPSLTAFGRSTSGITHQDTGSLTIHKYEREPGAKPEGESQVSPEAGVPKDATPLPGVTYTVTQTHSFDGKDWTKVSKPAQTYSVTTGEDGTVKISNMPVGRYTVKETEGPNHVILNTNEFSVDIPMTYNNGKDLAYDVKIYPKNETIRGNGELIKKGENGEPLKGIQFGLFNKKGNPVQEDKNDVVLTTDDKGKFGFEGLPAGEYYFQELTTIPGYALNNTKIYFEVKKNKDEKDREIVVEWVTVDGFIATDEHGNVVVTNYNRPTVEKDAEGKPELNVDRDKEYKYNITLKTPGDIDKYKNLGVTDTLDNRLEFITDGSVTDGWEVTGTAKENIEFLQEGQKLKWSVKDLTALNPNSEINITFTAKIKADAELVGEETGIPNNIEINFDNDRGQIEDPDEDDPDEPVVVKPTEGGLQIIKVDKSDNNLKLAGAKFKLTTDKEGDQLVDASGTVIKVNGTIYNGPLENLATTDEGTIVIDGLTPGTYYIHETKAPVYTDDQGVEKPYRLLTKPIEIEIVDTKTSTKNDVTVKNAKSGWDLPTTGGIGTVLFTATGLVLMGAAFYILRKDKNDAQA